MLLLLHSPCYVRFYLLLLSNLIPISSSTLEWYFHLAFNFWLFKAHNMMVIANRHHHFHLILSTGRASISLVIEPLSYRSSLKSCGLFCQHPNFEHSPFFIFFFLLPPFFLLGKEFERESDSHWRYVGWVSESDTNSKYPWWLIKCYKSKGLNFCFSSLYN